MENIKELEEQKKLIEDIKEHNIFGDLDDWIAEEEKKQEEMIERVEQNIQECQSDEGFDWEEYQYLCDIAEYWDCEE